MPKRRVWLCRVNRIFVLGIQLTNIRNTFFVNSKNEIVKIIFLSEFRERYWYRLRQRLLISTWKVIPWDKNEQSMLQERLSKKSPSRFLGEMQKKWPHRMRHNQRSHNYEGSWDPRKPPINYAERFFDSLGRSPQLRMSRRSKTPFCGLHLLILTLS